MLKSITLKGIYNDSLVSEAWLKSLKIKIEDTRLPTLVKYAKHFSEDYPQYLDKKIPVFTDYVESFLAIDEVCTLNLVRTYLNPESDNVKKKIIKYVMGKFNPPAGVDDTALNYLYELETAAYLLYRGYNVSDELNDVNYKINKYKINIQCKRLQSCKKINTGFKEALFQLKNQNKITSDKNSYGFVAMSLERIFKLNTDIRKVKDMKELDNDMIDLKNQMSKIVAPLWNKSLNEIKKELKLLGMMYLYKRPVYNVTNKKFTYFRRFLYDVPYHPKNTPYSEILNYIDSKPE